MPQRVSAVLGAAANSHGSVQGTTGRTLPGYLRCTASEERTLGAPARPGDKTLSIVGGEVTVPEQLDTTDARRAVSRGSGTRAALAGPGESHAWLAAIAAVALVTVLATNLISLGVDHLRTSVINANWEFSWSHDLDTVLLGVGVYASLVGARAKAHRWLWIAAATILALFVLDEVSAVHGQFGNLDKLVYAPILAALVVCVWRLTEGTSERMLVSAGLMTLLFAFAMHVAGLHLLKPIGYTTYVYQVGVGFKQGTELAGLILLVAALAPSPSR